MRTKRGLSTEQDQQTEIETDKKDGGKTTSVCACSWAGPIPVTSGTIIWNFKDVEWDL